MEISVLALYTIQYLIRMPSYSLPENEFLYDEVIHNRMMKLFTTVSAHSLRWHLLFLLEQDRG